MSNPEFQERCWAINQIEKDDWVDPWTDGYNILVDRYSSYRQPQNEDDDDNILHESARFS